MAAFDQLPPWSFDNIKFPVVDYNVRCRLRDHVHTYPHSPGGAPEKLGRELYTIRARGNFQTRFPKFGANLWPGDMADLRDRFENQLTSDLLIPTVGTIKAYIVSWDQQGSGKTRSGEFVDIEFREDQASAFLINKLINVKVPNLVDAGDALLAAANDAGLDFGDAGKSLTDMINSVTSIADQVNLYGSLYASKLDGIANACSNLEATFADLGKPANWTVANALHDVWHSAVTTRQDVLRQAVPIIFYATPTVMSTTDVATALYKDPTRGGQIMQLNALEDPWRIPANTNLRVYAA